MQIGSERAFCISTNPKKEEFIQMKLKTKRALLLIIILSVVLLAFKTDTIAYLLSDKNYEDAAERMATFIVNEYNRQKAQLVEDIRLNEIVRLAKKLDETRSLSVICRDFGESVFVNIFLDIDGRHTVCYQVLELK
jgi:hypothetical protein